MQPVYLYILDCLLAITTLCLSLDSLGPTETTNNLSFVAKRVDHINSATNLPTPFDFRSAEKCYKSWVRYKSSLSNTPNIWERCNPPKTLSPSDFVPYSGTSILKSIQTIRPGSTYQICDGITRFRFSPGTSSTTSTTHITLIHHGWELGTWTTQCTDSEEDLPPRPKCPVPPLFCDNLWESHLAKMRTFSEREPFQRMSDAPLYPCGAPSECVLDAKQEVVLLYWPPTTTTARDACVGDGAGLDRTAPTHTSRTRVETITRVSFRGKDLYRLSWISGDRTATWNDTVLESSVMIGSWELTSPTIYLAHRPITVYRYDRQDGGGVGMLSRSEKIHVVRDSGLVALRSRDLFSQRPILFKSDGGYSEARKIANGLWRPEPGQLLAGENIQYEARAFKFEHLANPVPASEYLEARDDCWGEQNHCATITDDSYRPRLLVANHVWRSYISDEYVCRLPTVVDPPIVLSKIDSGNLPLQPMTIPEFAPYATPTSLPREGRPGSDLFAPLPGAPSPRPKAVQNPWPRQTEASRSGKVFPGNQLNNPNTNTGNLWTPKDTGSREKEGSHELNPVHRQHGTADVNAGQSKIGGQTNRINRGGEHRGTKEGTVGASWVDRDEGEFGASTESDSSDHHSSWRDNNDAGKTRIKSMGSLICNAYFYPWYLLCILMLYSVMLYSWA